jgi:hypothetical protein
MELSKLDGFLIAHYNIWDILAFNDTFCFQDHMQYLSVHHEVFTVSGFLMIHTVYMPEQESMFSGIHFNLFLTGVLANLISPPELRRLLLGYFETIARGRVKKARQCQFV